MMGRRRTRVLSAWIAGFAVLVPAASASGQTAAAGRPLPTTTPTTPSVPVQVAPVPVQPASNPEALVDPSGLPVEVRGVLEGEFSPDFLPRDPAVAALAPYLHRRVAKVVTKLALDSFQDVAVPTITVPADTRFTTELARALLAQALAGADSGGGRFGDGSVGIVPSGDDAVTVVVTLRAQKVLGDVSVDLHDAPFSREELLRVLEVGPGTELSAGDIPRLALVADEFFVKRGYPGARIFFDVRRAPRSTADTGLGDAVLVIDVAPGTPLRLARRSFVVAAGDFGEVAGELEKYKVKAGERADEDTIAAADADLEQRLRGRGFFQATVRSRVLPENGTTRLAVEATLGPRSEVRFEGASHFDGDTLRGALDLEHETERSAAHLGDKLRVFYKNRGFLDVDLSVEYRGGPLDKLHLLVFHIVENNKVVVRKRVYPCLTAGALALVDKAPRDATALGNEIDSFLEEDLPGGDLTRAAAPAVDDAFTLGAGRGAGLPGSFVPGGRRAAPLDLEPKRTFVAETYVRAADHLQSLYRADGYLAAVVGPVQPLRRACAKGTPPDQCLPIASKVAPVDVCAVDARGLPTTPPDPDPRLVCVPDAATGATCESELDLRIPIKLGPRTILWDVQFQGARAIAPSDLLAETGLSLGSAASTVALDDARRKLLTYYQARGYAFAQVKWVLDKSPDNTRGRARFEIAEGDLVVVGAIEIHGNPRTREAILRKRIVLEVGQPYTTAGVRRTQELLGALGVFSAVDIHLEDPYLPQKKKTVIVTVTERPLYVLEASGGFYTAEGFRVGGEFGDRNVLGRAISFGVVGNVAYLPTPLVIDPVARANFGDLDFGARVAGRLTASLQFPETGLGPLFRGSIDALAVHDLQRDFYVRKFAVAPTLTFSPARNFQIQFSPSVEANATRIFGDLNVTDPSDPRARAFLYPRGSTYAFAQKLSVSWDRRDNSLDATRGTFFSFGAEHVDAFPVGSTDPTKPKCLQDASDPSAANFCESHFVKLQTTIAGYVPIRGRLRFAVELRAGMNVPLVASSKTYPDRLFFLGGAESMRAYLPNTFIPQDQADTIQKSSDPVKQAAGTIVRGGDLLINPHAELRIPLSDSLETVVFVDAGNLWRDPASYPWRDGGRFVLHYSVGTGIRLLTPVFPLALDIGINPNPRPWELGYNLFNFRIGLF